MDNFVDERDYSLLSLDKYTFSVLSRIIGSECQIRLTDHEKLIICFTGQPYPVWIWTPDGASEDDFERAYQIAKENALIDGEHNFNIKYELAEYFIRRAAEDGVKLAVTTNLFAYDCPSSISPSTVVDGELHKCTEDDIDALVDFFDMFHNAVGIDKQSREEYRKSAEDGVNSGMLYLWKNVEGEFVASCNWHPVQDMASIGLVFTRNEYRRKHYAEHLVYEVTEIARSAGYLPMLYTDADYVASNACYEKIGYVLRGKLCTIGKKIKKIQLTNDDYWGYTKRLRHACRGIVVNDGKVLLNYESKNNKYMIPGGGVEGEESYAECCERELLEETGMKVKAVEEYLEIEELFEDWRHVCHYFVCELIQDTGNVSLTDAEKAVGCVGTWVPFEEAIKDFGDYERFHKTAIEDFGLYRREYNALNEFSKLK